jgi:hypothetical protein
MEDEAEATSSSWAMQRKHNTAWRRRLEERWHRGGEMEETMPVVLTRIFLGQKIKKIYMVDSAATNGR